MSAFLRLSGNVPSLIHLVISDVNMVEQISLLSFSIFGGILYNWNDLVESHPLKDIPVYYLFHALQSDDHQSPLWQNRTIQIL